MSDGSSAAADAATGTSDTTAETAAATDAQAGDSATAGADGATTADSVTTADLTAPGPDSTADAVSPPADAVQPPVDSAATADATKPPADVVTPPTDAASGACTNAADQAILAKPDIDKTIESCALKSFGNAEGAKKCIVTDTGMSANCAGCFGTMLACTFSKCIGSCMGGNTPECKKCNDKECIPAFEKCAGVSQD